MPFQSDAPEGSDTFWWQLWKNKLSFPKYIYIYIYISSLQVLSSPPEFDSWKLSQGMIYITINHNNILITLSPNHHHHHHHLVTLTVLNSLIHSLFFFHSQHRSLSSISPGRSSKIHSVSTQSWCISLMVGRHWCIHVYESMFFFFLIYDYKHSLHISKAIYSK